MIKLFPLDMVLKTSLLYYAMFCQPRRFLFLILCVSMVSVTGLCAAPISLFPQTKDTGALINQDKVAGFLKDIHLNLYIRSSFELPLAPEKDLSQDAFLSAFKLNEGRFEVVGTVWKNLTFRMRTRFSTTRPQFALSNSNHNIDYALIGYKFGGYRKPLELAVGKQNNMLGSWEFWHNPTFEYRYSSIGGGRSINIFPLGARLSYAVTNKHVLTIQAFNTFANAFNNHIPTPMDLRPIRLPVSVLLAWKGLFMDDKLKTWYSFAVKNYVKNKPSYQVALGHNIVVPRFNLYLDLITAYNGVDYTKLHQSSYTAYYNSRNPHNTNPVIARDFLYSSAILRVDYELVRKFFLTTKAWYERADALKDNQLGSGFSNNLSFLIGCEYKPFPTQDMRIFSYYYNTRMFYNNAIPKQILPGSVGHTIALGVLYFVRVF